MPAGFIHLQAGTRELCMYFACFSQVRSPHVTWEVPTSHEKSPRHMRSPHVTWEVPTSHEKFPRHMRSPHVTWEVPTSHEKSPLQRYQLHTVYQQELLWVVRAPGPHIYSVGSGSRMTLRISQLVHIWHGSFLKYSSLNDPLSPPNILSTVTQNWATFVAILQHQTEIVDKSMRSFQASACVIDIWHF